MECSGRSMPEGFLVKTIQSLHKVQQTANQIPVVFSALFCRTVPVIAFVCLGTIASVAQKDPVDWVNLYIGTGSGPIGYGGGTPLFLPPSAPARPQPHNSHQKNSLSPFQHTHPPTSLFFLPPP